MAAVTDAEESDSCDLLSTELNAFRDLIYLFIFRLLPCSSAYGCRRESVCHPLHSADSEVQFQHCSVHLKILNKRIYCVSGSSNNKECSEDILYFTVLQYSCSGLSGLFANIPLKPPTV